MSLVIMIEFNPASQELAYDLRQRYAKIVGDHLEDIALSRKERNYPEWFKALEDLYTITEYKFKQSKRDKEIIKKFQEKEKDKSKFEFPDYTKLKKELFALANEHTGTWAGTEFNSDEVGKIEVALRNIEEWLYFKMNEVNMFGGKRDTEGL